LLPPKYFFFLQYITFSPPNQAPAKKSSGGPFAIAHRRAYTFIEVILLNLHELPPGNAAFIDTVSPSPLSERLCSLGFLPGSRIVCAFRAAGGGPSAYRIGGALLALRRSDAKTIKIRHEP